MSSYQFEFDARAERVLNSYQKLMLFRVLSEAVTNVFKHARGDRLEVSARLIDTQLIAVVEDNGVGTPPYEYGNGHGCLNIRERARLIGAAVQWRASRFSQGTCFELTLPVHHADIDHQ
jgi:signal transduction histidine kinase